MRNIIVVIYIFLHVNLFAKENLYVHFPSDLLSQKTQTSFGIELMAIENDDTNDIIHAKGFCCVLENIGLQYGGYT